jgi:excisionase family DNA binding protein
MENSKKKIEGRLSKIESQLNPMKKIMNVKELSYYIGMAESYIYKLSSAKIIPHYSPLGKMIYFDRDEINEWILSNKIHDPSEENLPNNTKRGLNRKK